MSSCVARSELANSLSDREFWTLIATLSEPPGTFPLSENLVSNEPDFVENIRQLRPAGGVYIGVGPEQNYSYIARLRPEIAFIVDIRLENRNLHLLYKALFELSTDRADFVSRLFSRPKPHDVAANAEVNDIFARSEQTAPSEEQCRTTAGLVRDRLTSAHGFALTESDLADFDRILREFLTAGPAIQFWGARPVHADAVRPSYRQLMTGRDIFGQTRSFLASDAAFRFVQDLHVRNLILPVVGDFGGPTALRRIGDYIRQHGAVIRAFYGSNVGVYLNRQQTRAFCTNLGSLPFASRATFIESDYVRSIGSKLDACVPSS